jgi:serine/threonine-protein kinase
MPAKVTLTVTEGQLASQVFTFDENTTSIVGRAKDCLPRLPNDEFHQSVSRHHCLLDINPPDIRVRDFGSLNGTYVNGVRIGSRQQQPTSLADAAPEFPQYDLHDGDEIKLGKTVFRVGINLPTVCATCAEEIPESEKDASLVDPDTYQCRTCRDRARDNKQSAPLKAKGRVCVVCRQDVSGEVGDRQGDFACAACKADPLKLVKYLMMKADQGQKDLPAIKGYKILKELGRGGMGAVFLAQNQMDQKLVALKIMLPQVAADQRAQELFLREARVTKALKHPNIVQLHDSGASDGTFFFTLEFCDGGSLDKLLLARGGKLPIEEALEIMYQALAGLDYAQKIKVTTKTGKGDFVQKKGLVHRDIKPANIFLSGSGSDRVAKLADLGLAKAFRTAGLSGLTATGSAAGSPWFMPRQQVIRYKYATPEVDVWAMAAVLYNMLTGFAPRNFPTHKDPWLVVLQDPVIPIKFRNPSIPDGLAQVIDDALDDSGQLHIDSAGDFMDFLKVMI